MGRSDYTIFYKTDSERDKINDIINKYKELYLKTVTFGSDYDRFMNLKYKIDFSKLNENESRKAIEKIRDENHDIDFSSINIYNDDTDDEYIRYELLIKTHQQISTNKHKNIIRVLFNMGGTSSFCYYLEKNKFKFDVNIFDEDEYEIEERYECILKDSNGNNLPECL